MSMARGHIARAHPLWLAHLVHRLSGLALALFLPVHFWVLSLAMTDPARLEGFFALTSAHVAKLAEMGLVFLLAVHMFGGLRLLALDWLPMRAGQKTLSAAAVALAFAVALLFLLQAM